jgi:hypothetical protein
MSKLRKETINKYDLGFLIVLVGLLFVYGITMYSEMPDTNFLSCRGDPPALVEEEDVIVDEEHQFTLPAEPETDEVFSDEYTEYYIEPSNRTIKDRLEDKRLLDGLRSKERWN